MAFYIVTPKSQAELNQLVSLLHSAHIPQAEFDRERLQIDVPMVVFKQAGPEPWSSEWYARITEVPKGQLVLTVNEFGDLLNRS